MSGNKQLNDLLQKARQEPPIMSIEEVHSIINEAAPAKAKSNLKISRTLKMMIMSSLSTVIAVIFFFWMQNPQEPIQTKHSTRTNTLNHNKVIAQKKKETSIHSTEHLNQENKQETSNLNQSDSPKSEPKTSIQNNKPNLPINTKEDKGTERETSPSNQLQPTAKQSRFISLNDEEWESLNIKMREDIFQYFYQQNPLSHRLIRAVISTISIKANSTYNIRSGKNEDKMFLPFGLSRNDGTDFFAMNKEALRNNNEALRVGNLVAFSSPKHPDFVVWYTVNKYLLKQLEHRTSEIENRSTKDYPKSFKNKEYPKKKITEPTLCYIPNCAVFADKKLMEKLGFTFKNDQINYNQRIENAKVDFKYKKGDVEYITIWPKFSIKSKSVDTYPRFISEQYSRYPKASFLFQKNKDPRLEFMANRHNLVPVVYKIPNDTVEFVAWFEPDFDFFSHLDLTTEKRIRTELAKYKQSQIVLNTDAQKKLSYEELFIDGESNVEGIKLLELDDNTLAKLNIFKEDNGIAIIMDSTTVVFDKNGARILLRQLTTMGKLPISIKEAKPNKVSPLMITDDLAQATRMYEANENTPTGDDANQESIDAWLKENMMSSFLIPILVRTGDVYTPKDKLEGKIRPDCIFWYEPTDDFLNKLPENIANDIRTEMVGITKNQEIETLYKVDVSKISTTNNNDSLSQCNYFEMCKNTKNAIDECSLYPNPASSLVHIQIKTNQSCQAVVTLASINGTVLKKARITLEKDFENITQMQLNGLSEGMYLVLIETTTGDFITKRIVKVK